MIGEFSTDALFLLGWDHCDFLSDLFGGGFVHGFGEFLFEFDVLLGLLGWGLTHLRIEKSYKIKIITFFP